METSATVHSRLPAAEAEPGADGLRRQTLGATGCSQEFGNLNGGAEVAGPASGFFKATVSTVRNWQGNSAGST